MPNRSWTVGEIRLKEPLKAVCQAHAEIECRFVAVFDVTSEDLENTNIVILQRIASPFVERLAKKLLALQIPYIYEIDDLLWNMPRELLSFSAWSRNKKRLFFLLKNASAITTSTQNLADKLCELNKNIYVIPNLQKCYFRNCLTAFYADRLVSWNNKRLLTAERAYNELGSDLNKNLLPGLIHNSFSRI